MIACEKPGHEDHEDHEDHEEGRRSRVGAPLFDWPPKAARMDRDRQTQTEDHSYPACV